MDDKADDNLRTGPRQLLVPFLCLSSREAAPSGATPWGFRSAQNVIRRRRRAGLWRPGAWLPSKIWAETKAGGAPSARSRPRVR